MKRKYLALSSVAALLAGMTVVGTVGASAREDHTAGTAATTSHRSWASKPASSVAEAQRLADAARASGTSTDVAAAQTLILVEAPYSPPREAFVDLAPAGDSAGDFFISEARIFDRSRLVGKDAVRCELGLRTFTCEATLLVNGKGKIRVAGTLFAEQDNVLPVTGGTDAYEGVGGQLTIFNLPGGRTALVFHLTR